MAFYYGRKFGEDEPCDKCNKASTAENPIIVLQISARRWQNVRFIQIHEKCFTKLVAKLKEAEVTVNEMAEAEAAKWMQKGVGVSDELA